MIKRASVSVIFALVAAVLLCGGGMSAAAAPASGVQATAVLTAPLSVESGHIKTSDAYAEIYAGIDAAYPVISGMKDTAFQSSFNKAVREDVAAFVDSLLADAKKGREEAAAHGYAFIPYSFCSAVEKRRNDGRLLCVAVRMETYAGGAHPFPESRFYTLENSMPARRLSLPDLFVDPAAGMVHLNGLIRKKIAADPGGYFEGADSTAGANTWFYLTDRELHVVYPAYSVAPGAAGEPDFGLELDLFKDMLIPEATTRQ
jgi:hypothetical protein